MLTYFFIFSVPCHVPPTEYGIYTMPSDSSPLTLGSGQEDRELNETDPVPNGQVVHFSCEYGYVIYISHHFLAQGFFQTTAYGSDCVEHGWVYRNFTSRHYASLIKEAVSSAISA